MFRLYAEIPHAVAENWTVERQVNSHIQNSNYGHQGNDASAELYIWKDLTDYLVAKNRFEHDMLHACLGILCQEEGWDPFFADGNHQAEAMVIAIEQNFRFWERNHERINAAFNQDFFFYQANRYYERQGGKDQRTFLAGWVAASESDRSMSAFEARFLGVVPKIESLPMLPNVGDKNKWGEEVPEFKLDDKRLSIFYKKMMLVRARMHSAFKESGFDVSSLAVGQEFFKTLRMGELTEIISGRNEEQELSFDRQRLQAVSTGRGRPLRQSL